MAGPNLRSLPRRGELWLSRPPYLMLARVTDVDPGPDAARVSYQLHDADGAILESVDRAPLDAGWWRAFQPLAARFG